jgi:hypothetical protein
VPGICGGARAGQRSGTRAASALPPLAGDDIDNDPTPPALTAGPSQRDDVDEIAVERAPAGDHISYHDLTAVEQQEVVRRPTARGASIRDIATQLSTTKSTVSRRHLSAPRTLIAYLMPTG